MSAATDIVLVVGARPQFIKAAPVCAALAVTGAATRILHTGQHFDAAMSDVFFKELNLPLPAWNLGCGGGPHGAMTGAMLTGIEQVLLENRPGAVVVFGDTNSTLAGALAAAKLRIPVAHVEAGLRSGNRAMPEELNRICVDHLSDLLFCSSESGRRRLEAEGIRENVHVTGDIMADVFYATLRSVREKGSPPPVALPDKPWALMTLHRAANTEHPDTLQAVFSALGKAGLPVLFPVHPRTRQVIAAGLIHPPANVRCMDAVGYRECVALLDQCSLVLTDSGGLQKEACWAGKPCLTLREETEWTELVEAGWNVLTGTDPEAIAAGLAAPPFGKPGLNLYGDGHAARAMASLIAACLAA
jgi:UDP-GlcNAc3NAcA epimerase